MSVFHFGSDHGPPGPEHGLAEHGFAEHDGLVQKFLALFHASSIPGMGLGVSETLGAGLAMKERSGCRNQECLGAQVPQPQDSF